MRGTSIATDAVDLLPSIGIYQGIRSIATMPVDYNSSAFVSNASAHLDSSEATPSDHTSLYDAAFVGPLSK